MTEYNEKCVAVIDSSLPTGIIANTSAILGITLGKYIDKIIGPDVIDASGKTHLGIITIPVPILRGDNEILKNLRERLYSDEFADLITIDFSDIAQSCNIYADYITKAASTKEDNHHYFGIAIFGNKKKINKLTGFMPLLR
ncbi:DUF2000 domain-containing protein [Pectinatus brassicae]|uniref:DUF2000 domain-containing protein n=1 Tax=Pectinatus brassicae TaxID=862415 RepID=A0A840UW36_9FIRM|nr:DUF2000 domain-containing protein [Pectinatus brassicae]MBB5337103.1 hypothetical protein [Pectinatus brassicae]